MRLATVVTSGKTVEAESQERCAQQGHPVQEMLNPPWLERVLFKNPSVTRTVAQLRCTGRNGSSIDSLSPGCVETNPSFGMRFETP